VKLTPLDIRKQEFKKVMRGFDPDEVEAFLSMVADEMELLIREKNQTNDELIKLRTQLKDYQHVEVTLRETLIKAQNTVEESRVNSRREAEIMIHEAELQSDHILKEAREDLLNIRHEMSLVKTQKDSFSKRLRHLLQSQIELLEVMEMEDQQYGRVKADEEFKQRGRLPRREVPGQEPPPREQQSQIDKENPVIIRKSLEEEAEQQKFASELSDDTIENMPDEKVPEKNAGTISDQFIV
jgi:cell division initiation protein